MCSETVSDGVELVCRMLTPSLFELFDSARRGEVNLTEI